MLSNFKWLLFSFLGVTVITCGIIGTYLTFRPKTSNNKTTKEEKNAKVITENTEALTTTTQVVQPTLRTVSE